MSLFVPPERLQSMDVVLEPFWETEGDIEGECYLPYISQNPSFRLTVREGVCLRLEEAISALPTDWMLILKAGFRPYGVQMAVLEAFLRESKQRHPGWAKNQHLEYARTFVADPDIVCPPHITGGAIDVDIRNRSSGKTIDMGCPPNTDSGIAFLHSNQLTALQYENRKTLLNAMLQAGFAPNVYEWWHFQYGETYWAAFYGQEKTLYGMVK